MATQLEEREGLTAKSRQNYTWTQDGVGRPYVQSVLQTLDPGQSYQKQATTTQTLDVYGNVTQAVANNYAGMSPASRTQTVTYVTNTAYTSRYMRNRPLQVQITDGTETITVINSYDQAWGAGATVGTPRQHDGANYGTSWTLRGNVTQIDAPGKTTILQRDITGTVTGANDGQGHVVTYSNTSVTNFAAPSTVTPNGNSSLATSLGYSSFLGLSSATGPNGRRSR